MNIYSDSFQSALKYLKNTKVNIQNLLVITRDFNIRDNLWNLLYPYQAQFALEGESLQSWLGYTQNIEIICDKLGDMNLSEQPWPQLMCCAFYKSHGHNFRE